MSKVFSDFLSWTCEHEWGCNESHDLTLNNGTKLSVWDSGVLEVTPQNPGHKDIILSCAVHGNETAPIEICRDIIHDIVNEKQKVTHRTLFLIANPASINTGERFVEENMNRLFSGAHSKGEKNNRERIRAAKIEGYVERFYLSAPDGKRERFHYDLHTAIRDSKREKFAVYPFTHNGPYHRHQLQFLLACGVDTVLLNQAPTTTFSYFSVRQFDAHGFTVELGKVHPFGENDRTQFAAAESTFRQLIAKVELDFGLFEPEQHYVFKEAQTINRTQQDFELNFTDDVANFTSFSKHELLARDGEKKHYAQHNGERIIFPNARVALGHRALLTVVRIPTETLDLV